MLRLRGRRTLKEIYEALFGRLKRGPGAQAAGGGKTKSKSSPVNPSSTQAVNLEILKTLRKLRQDKGGDISGSGTDDEAGPAGHAHKAFKNLERLKSHIKVNGEAIEARYVKRWADRLTDGEERPWAWIDANNAIAWNGCTTARRARTILAAMLRILRTRTTPSKKEWEARGLLIQGLKSLEQHAVDKGSWRTAWLLTGLTDPCGSREFAGTEQELGVIVAYEEADKKLRTKVGTSQGGGGAVDEEAQSKRALKKAAAAKAKAAKDAAEKAKRDGPG